VALCLSPHRRGSFYGQLFRRAEEGWKAVSVIEVGSVSEIVGALEENPEVVCGPEEAQAQCQGWEGQTNEGRASFRLAYPSAAALLRLALERPTSVESRFAVPLYVRASQPEEKERDAERTGWGARGDGLSGGA
jgi:tRNA A37 threonylcarbamoyladenosine modification protein TsaB